MAIVEPVPDAPAATANLGDDTALVIADVHAGFEAALRADGVEVDDRGESRRTRILELIERTAVDRVVFLGDLAHWIGEPFGPEREEIEMLLEAVTAEVPATLVKGNHDGAIEELISIPVSETDGIRLGPIGFVHGHTWPAPEVLEAEVVCMGHEHPTIALEDPVGGHRLERVWLRGELASAEFTDHVDVGAIEGELIVCPAFNDLVGGTRVNLAEQEFLSPYLPGGLSNGQAYLLDGTRLGGYQDVS